VSISDTAGEMLKQLSSALDIEETSTNAKIIDTIARSIDTFRDQEELVTLAHYLGTAHGVQIDEIGYVFDVTRPDDCSDADYKVLIFLERMLRGANGTADDIRAAVRAITGVTDDCITITENLTGRDTKNNFTLNIRANDAVAYSHATLHNAVTQIKACGVEYCGDRTQTAFLAVKTITMGGDVTGESHAYLPLGWNNAPWGAEAWGGYGVTVSGSVTVEQLTV